jgi:hypothetical protein
MKSPGRGPRPRSGGGAHCSLSSLLNTRGKRAILYDRRNGRGETLCIDPRGAVESLAVYGFNDLASSSRNTKNKNLCPI